MKAKGSAKKWRWILGAVLIAATGGMWLWKGSRSGDGERRETTVKRGDLQVSILSTGTVQPENRLEIKPPVAGRVEKVLVKEGQRVRKGQRLAWISSTERAALLDAARAQGPAEQKKWEENYRPTPVLAPIPGTIILRNVESGQTFTSNDSILVMSDRLTVKAQVDETDIAQIKLGQTAEIVLDAYPQERVPARVDQIAFDAKTVNNVTTYIVDVLPDATPDFMRSGMTANVTFRLRSKENILLVPADAIRVRDGKYFTQLKPSPGKSPEDREIEVGLTDGKRMEVTSGLTEGDVVLSTSLPRKSASDSKGGSNPFSPMGNRKGH